MATVTTQMHGQAPITSEHATDAEARAVYERAIASRVYAQVHISDGATERNRQWEAAERKRRDKRRRKTAGIPMRNMRDFDRL